MASVGRCWYDVISYSRLGNRNDGRLPLAVPAGLPQVGEGDGPGVAIDVGHVGFERMAINAEAAHESAYAMCDHAGL